LFHTFFPFCLYFKLCPLFIFMCVSFLNKNNAESYTFFMHFFFWFCIKMHTKYPLPFERSKKKKCNFIFLTCSSSANTAQTITDYMAELVEKR
jgi:hypothetical protein